MHFDITDPVYKKIHNIVEKEIKANRLIVFKSVCKFAILQLIWKGLHTLHISRYIDVFVFIVI